MPRTIRSAALLLAVLSFVGGPVLGRAQQGSTQAKPEQGQKPGSDQAQPPAPQQPTFKTGINYVRVDAIISDDPAALIDWLKAKGLR